MYPEAIVKKYLRTAVYAFLLASLLLYAGPAAEAQERPTAGGATPASPREVFPPADRVAEKKLSEYLPILAGSPGDTPVYIIDGDEPGGTVFICAGTHGNEISGVIAAAIFAERARLSKGRLIVLPRANLSAAGYPDPDKPGPAAVRIPTSRGERVFLYGARRTSREDEGRPDPQAFVHPGSAVPQAGEEARNLDRNYPGSADGGLTARVARAIMNLIELENVDVAFDLHESGPESKLAWLVVANPKNVDTAAMAVLGLEEAGIRMAVDVSAGEPRGLSHREWGDMGKAMAFLTETPNPAQVAPPRSGDTVNDPVAPLSRRVSVQLATVAAIIEACNEALPEGSRVILAGIPSPEDIEASGLGAFLE